MLIYLGDLFHTWTKGGVWTIPLNVGYVGSYAKNKLEQVLPYLTYLRINYFLYC